MVDRTTIQDEAKYVWIQNNFNHAMEIGTLNSNEFVQAESGEYEKGEIRDKLKARLTEDYELEIASLKASWEMPRKVSEAVANAALKLDTPMDIMQFAALVFGVSRNCSTSALAICTKRLKQKNADIEALTALLQDATAMIPKNSGEEAMLVPRWSTDKLDRFGVALPDGSKREGIWRVYYSQSKMHELVENIKSVLGRMTTEQSMLTTEVQKLTSEVQTATDAAIGFLKDNHTSSMAPLNNM